MERVQPAVAQVTADVGSACISCHSAVDGTRCGHCGATRSAGAFRTIRVIAQTAHSRMYLAEDGEGRRVALKELMFALVPGVEQVRAFEREAEVLRGLQHSQVPAFASSFTEGSGVGTRFYLAQEFIDGESLQQRLGTKKLTEDETWRIAEQALEVLQHLHTRTPSLLHRDVKPANVILKPGGTLALVDFGAVRELSRELTHGSTLVGTFGYMPPEQLGGTVDATSDLYALGATLVHAFTGVSPADLLVEGMELKFDQHLDGASAKLKAFLQRLAASRRSARFSSAAEALEALRSTEAKRPSRRRWIIGAVAAAGLAIAAGLAVMVNDEGLLAGPRPADDLFIEPVARDLLSQPEPPMAAAPVESGPSDHRNFTSSWPSQREPAVGKRAEPQRFVNAEANWSQPFEVTLGVELHVRLDRGKWLGVIVADPDVVHAQLRGGNWMTVVGKREGRTTIFMKMKEGGYSQRVVIVTAPSTPP